MIVLHVDFALRMASTKWKSKIEIFRQKRVICHSLCHNINMRKLLVILVVIELFIKLGFDVKMRSIQDKESLVICVS